MAFRLYSLESILVLFFRLSRASISKLLPVTLAQDRAFLMRLLQSLLCASRRFSFEFVVILTATRATSLLLRSMSFSLQSFLVLVTMKLSSENSFPLSVSLSYSFSLRPCHISPPGSSSLGASATAEAC
ncbi:hypothetical protein PI124_g17272 [Phytophthora idaei]|nr:hypothetical protein PI125_g1012 [Phytophthora idaei]KAG3139202.1 hypothetical protein PI126_g16556 [Phytophthora idaei]KAG3237752.1 hypothetical protein PI124_g17272 [Phytophthora idaei]